MTDSPLLNAIDWDAYDYLSEQAPHFLEAIEQELAKGATPSDIRYMARRQLGPERQALVVRLEQAARYIARMNA